MQGHGSRVVLVRVRVLVLVVPLLHGRRVGELPRWERGLRWQHRDVCVRLALLQRHVWLRLGVYVCLLHLHVWLRLCVGLGLGENLHLHLGLGLCVYVLLLLLLLLR